MRELTNIFKNMSSCFSVRPFFDYAHHFDAGTLLVAYIQFWSGRLGIYSRILFRSGWILYGSLQVLPDHHEEREEAGSGTEGIL